MVNSLLRFASTLTTSEGTSCLFLIPTARGLFSCCRGFNFCGTLCTRGAIFGLTNNRPLSVGDARPSSVGGTTLGERGLLGNMGHMI